MIKGLLVTLFLFVSIVLVQRSWRTQHSLDPILINPTKTITRFTFGHDDTVADTLWLRLIQDYNLCEHQNRKEAKSKGEDIGLRYGKNRVVDCERGWVFRMLDVITDLAPKFRMPYATGGIMLSVVVDDVQGASVIFDKAVQNFPKDWSILYRAAYHALYEEENIEKAAGLFRLAGKNGAPFWVNSLAARLYSKSDRAAFGVKILIEYLKNFEHTLSKEQKESLVGRIKELREEQKAQEK